MLRKSVGRSAASHVAPTAAPSRKNDSRPVVPGPSQQYLSRRTVALIALVLQNASVSLLTRLSRTPTSAHGALYAPSVAVFTAEILKSAVSLTMLVRERQALDDARAWGSGAGMLVEARRVVWDLMVNQREEMIKLAVPGGLYALQNTLLYTALSNLDAATYQTTYQLKLLTAALFSVLLFRRALSRVKWFALVLLTAGVATVQLDGARHPSARHASEGAQDPRVGLAAILAACISSGLAGGWFEYVLKAPAPPPSPSPSSARPASEKAMSSSAPPSSPPPTRPAPLLLRTNSPSLWARNLQLGVPSLLFSLAGIYLSADWPRLLAHGPLQGFSPLVWGVVANQAIGGLLVAMVVREADSVAKGFATSIAIVLSTLAGVVFFGLIPGPLFVVGAALVISSTIIYAIDG